MSFINIIQLEKSLENLQLKDEDNSKLEKLNELKKQVEHFTKARNFDKATALIKQMHSLAPEDNSIKSLLDKVQALDNVNYSSWLENLIEGKLEEEEGTKIKICEELAQKAKHKNNSVLISIELFTKLICWIWDECNKGSSNSSINSFLINYSTELCIQTPSEYLNPSTQLFSLLELDSKNQIQLSIKLSWVAFYYQLLNQALIANEQLSETYFIQFTHFVVNIYSNKEVEDGQALVKIAALITYEPYAKSLTKETETLSNLLDLISLNTDSALYGASLLIWTKLVSHNSIPNLLFPTVSNHLDTKFSGNSESDRLKGHRLLKTIFHFYSPWGIHILSQEGWLQDAIETFEVESEQIKLTMLDWLSLSCNDTKFRQALKPVFQEYSSPLLNSSNKSIKLSAILIQSKLHPDKISSKEIESIVELFIKEDNSSQISLSNTIEVITYSSLKDDVRAYLAKNANFWRFCLKSIEYGKLTNPIIYGICVILSNISTYPTPLTKEQRQVKQLQAMSNNQGKTDKKAHIPTEEEQQAEFNRLTELTKELNKKLVNNITIDLWQILIKNQQFNVWSTSISVMLGWSTDSQLHPKLLQRGAVPALISKLPKVSGDDQVSQKLLIIQILSKLSIHTDPKLAFNQQTPWDLINLFVSILDPKSLLNTKSNPLQRFEAVMALTNLTSLGAEYRDKVFKLGAIQNLELMMLSDHPMLRRTSTECICNLAYSQSGMDYYVKYPGKLHPLMAMTQIDDLPTRLAAGGALASLSQLPPIRPILLNHNKLYLMVDGLTWNEDEDPNQQELLRAIEFWYQLVEYSKQNGELDKIPKDVKDKINKLSEVTNIQSNLKSKIETIKEYLN